MTHLKAFRAIFCLPTRATLGLNPTSSSSSSELDESSEESTATTAATSLHADAKPPLASTAGLRLVTRDTEEGKPRSGHERQSQRGAKVPPSTHLPAVIRSQTWFSTI